MSVSITMKRLFPSQSFLSSLIDSFYRRSSWRIRGAQGFVLSLSARDSCQHIHKWSTKDTKPDRVRHEAAADLQKNVKLMWNHRHSSSFKSFLSIFRLTSADSSSSSDWSPTPLSAVRDAEGNRHNSFDILMGPAVRTRLPSIQRRMNPSASTSSDD